jgi:hypothetical protein
MAPRGPILPRKSTAPVQHEALLGSTAFQAGIIFAVERNRRRLTQ